MCILELVGTKLTLNYGGTLPTVFGTWLPNLVIISIRYFFLIVVKFNFFQFPKFLFISLNYIYLYYAVILMWGYALNVKKSILAFPSAFILRFGIRVYQGVGCYKI